MQRCARASRYLRRMPESTTHTHPATPIFPPARVRVTTPRLELRLPTDAEIVALCAVANDGVHDPNTMPFAQPWSDEQPDMLARNAYAWQMRARATFTPDRWTMLFCVFLDGEPVGAQDVIGHDFGVLREVSTASWLGKRYQGRGIGTEMREAGLHFAFEGLGALASHSGAWGDNPASNRVSEKAGYHVNGTTVDVRRRGPDAPGGASAERVDHVNYRIERDAWLERRRDDIEVHGLDDEVLAAFGVTPER